MDLYVLKTCFSSHSFSLSFCKPIALFSRLISQVARLQTGGLVVNGGDIGARGTGSGPFLSGGVAIDVLTGVQTQPTRNIIADSVRLGTGVTVGDIQTNRFVNGVGTTHGTVSGLVPLPVVPTACGASPGTSNLTVGTGATVTASPGQFAAVSVGTGGKLRLNSGRYDMTNLTVGTGARIEALGSVQIRVASRLSTSASSFIGAASGTTLTARDLRIEISGQNGTTGALGATPPAASLGTGNVVTALILVPNGTLSMGTGIVATGAFMARDIDVGGAGAKIVFQDGFAACTVAGCDDGNPCTVDGCSACGECTHAAALAGTSCGNGNACDGTEACDGAGHCVSGTPVTCAPPDQCHSAGVCNPATGLCSNPPLPDGTPCNDGNLCTQTDTCESGLCTGSNPVACGPADQCHEGGTCNPATGVCSKPAKPDGTLCNDGNACTHTDVCEGGACLGSEPVVCAAADQCHKVGVCNSTTGVCSNPNKDNGTACSDGNACTRTDACQAGACVGANPVVCTASDQCHDIGACDSTTGACSNPAKADGTACDDGSACTQGDTCQGGACIGSSSVVCVASDQCHAAGACNPATGACSNPAMPDGTGCTDGNACTQMDICQAGVCVGTSPVSCPAADQCHAAGTCDTGTGSCSSPEKEDETACDDGNEQTQKDSCEGGTCIGRIPCIPVSKMSAGGNHTCAVRTDGILWCWGGNESGQLGDGTTETRLAPVRVPGQGWAVVAAGSGFTCATRTDGTLRCWGTNWAGQLGNGTNQDSAEPVQVEGTTWTFVDAGLFHACGIKTDKSLWCWGLNWWGQLGQGGASNGSWTPVPVQLAGQSWKSVHSYGATVCGIHEDGALWCWGQNWHGQLGDGSSGDNVAPVQVGGAEWKDVSPGSYHTCAIKTDGMLWCWGWNGEGEFANGTYAGSSTPVQGKGEGYSSLESGDEHICSVREDGTLWCWGANGNGQLGNGTYNGAAEPIRVRGRDWADVVAGASHVCGRRQDGSMWCWGANDSGQMGDGTVVGKLLPEQIAGELCRVVPVCGDGHMDEGETCDDGNHVSGDGCSADCQIEKCFGVVCAAGDQCNSGSCDPATGQCVVSAKADGVSCDDGNPCTQSDTCQAGVCVGANPVACAASDQCHVAGTCDPSTGGCSNPTQPDGISCNDGNACTQTDTCQAGQCVGANPVACAASDQCHGIGACDSTTGACSNPALPDGTGCDDGNACTQGDTCQGGACTGSSWVVCGAGDQCHAAGVCNPATGACSNPTMPDGTGCNDGNACTQTDICQAGSCVGTSPVQCAALDQCHDAGNCDPATGVCSNPAKSDGVACSDGNPCTQGDSCRSGTCASGSPVVCTALDQCHNAGSCNPSTGVCSNPAKADGTACNDGNACTATDTCTAGTCVGSNPTKCVALDQCHDVGVCDPGTGICSIPLKPNGSQCDDGKASTAGDSCTTGVCAGAISVAYFQSQVTPIAPSVPTALVNSTAFLYSGSNPIQTGVVPGTIQAQRAGVVRGRVLTRSGDPLPLVQVTVVNHPELGQTTSREDGFYDLAVNAGTNLRIHYQYSGYLFAERNVETRWNDFAVVPDVTLVSLDPNTTTIRFGVATYQVARGSVETDADGTRQATLLFQPNTHASFQKGANSSSACAGALPKATVRATEYTVGPSGPASMPAPLPATTAYVYAAAYTIDEALPLGQDCSVQFDQPVISYLENFLNIPVGSVVPMGGYDTQKEYWCSMPNGWVVKVIGVGADGLAQLDVDGSGNVASASALAALGIQAGELQQLASLYQVGQSLWRVTTPHFSNVDQVNAPYGFPHGAVLPTNQPQKKDTPKKKPQNDPCLKTGNSIVECENQVLREGIGIAGTPFALHYSTRDAIGNRAPRQVDVHPGIGRYAAGIDPWPVRAPNALTMDVMVAGRTYTETVYDTLDFLNNDQFSGFEWDGLDVYGRLVQGAQPATVRVGFVYPVLYRNPADREDAFAMLGAGFPGDPLHTRTPSTITFINRVTTVDDYGQPEALTLGSSYSDPAELGGWRLNVHHRYDGNARLLLRGDGGQQSATDAGRVVMNITPPQLPPHYPGYLGVYVGPDMGLIRFRGHPTKGGYRGKNGKPDEDTKGQAHIQ